MESSGSGLGPMTGSSEDNNESSGYIQGEKCLANLGANELLKTFSGVSCYLPRYPLDRRVTYDYIRREIPRGHRKSNRDLLANRLRHIGLITNKRNYS
jgi:hypothetical protein